MSKVLFYTVSKFQQFEIQFFQPTSALIKPVTTFEQTQYYPFVSLIRFVSMIGIVWAHSIVLPGYNNERDFFNTVGHIKLYIAFMQIFKFGVICFFLISGFLLGDKIKKGDLLQYYKRRLRSTIRPYLIVLFIFITIVTYRVFIVKHDISEEHSSLLKIINYSIFSTSLWYLPNFLIALGVILIFYKFVDSKFFGGILFTITLLYTVFSVYNIKYQFGHTWALFGYVFYLWLGIYIRQNEIIIKKIKKIKLIPLVIILIVAFALSCYESYILYQNYLGYFNILRVFNQFYSLVMFVFLIRICNSNPNFGIFNPKKETYGIYLYHGLFSWFLLPKIIFCLKQNNIIDLNVNSIYTFMAHHLVYFIFIYLITTLLVKMLLKYNLGYLQSKISINI
jgi:hypothetical protein